MEKHEKAMSKKKELMFFIDAMGGGGAERVISVLVPEFVKDGFDVSIVMLRKKEIAYRLPEEVHLYYASDLKVSIYGKIVRKLFKIHNNMRAKIVPFLQKKGWFKNLPEWNETTFYFYSKFALPFKGFLKKHPVCTAFGFLIRSSVVLAMASKRLPVHTVYCERSNPKRHNIQDSLIRIRDRYYPKYKSGIFQTEEVMSYFTKLKGPKRIILNPIIEGLPEPYVGTRHHEIVTFCRLGQEKNLTMLIDAYEKLRELHPDFTLRIYGDGSEKDYLSEYIRNHGLIDCAEIKDFASDIHELVRGAYMYVSTSNYEGLSNSMLEAMAIGLPCICTDCDGGGARMMIDDHVNGLLIPKGDTDALYHAMIELVESEELCEELSANAVKVRQELTPEKIAKQWEDFAFSLSERKI